MAELIWSQGNDALKKTKSRGSISITQIQSDGTATDLKSGSIKRKTAAGRCSYCFWRLPVACNRLNEYIQSGNIEVVKDTKLTLNSSPVTYVLIWPLRPTLECLKGKI